jgi:serine/threonine-protein kinase
VPESFAALKAALAGRYDIQQELGRGGMASVYLAHDVQHDRPVALKVVLPELAAAAGNERFQREIRLAARLQHPHILSVYDSGEAAGQLWFTMPFVEGESLRDRLTRETQLPVEEAVRIVREAALALDYAHRHGVIHRDIKPENILLTDGQALVADFGIARALDAEGSLTGTGLAVGTPAYMSPEQATGEKNLDGRSDIYALGCVLYELLAGEPPFQGPTVPAIIARLLSETPRPLSTVRTAVSPALSAAVAKAMARTAADRFSHRRGVRPRVRQYHQRYRHPAHPGGRPVRRSAGAGSRSRGPPPWSSARSCWAISSIAAARAASAASRCFPSRTREPPKTSTSPTGSPTRCAASSPASRASR